MNFIEKKKLQRGQGGFTLIELLVVIAILAVLAGLAVIGIGAMRDNAKDTACRADLDTYNTALEAFTVSEPAPPADIAALEASDYIKRPSKYSDTFTITGDEVVSSDPDCSNA
jgi:prepilin-type N-terminal cleavage/methylation domain-containing protein